jgi:hypothetical protein
MTEGHVSDNAQTFRGYDDPIRAVRKLEKNCDRGGYGVVARESRGSWWQVRANAIR